MREFSAEIADRGPIQMAHFHRWIAIPKRRRHSHTSSVYVGARQSSATLTTECQRLINLKRDTKMVQQEPFKQSVSGSVRSMEDSPSE